MNLSPLYNFIKAALSFIREPLFLFLSWVKGREDGKKEAGNEADKKRLDAIKRNRSLKLRVSKLFRKR